MEPAAPRSPRPWYHPNRWSDWLFHGRPLQWTVPLVALTMVAVSSAFAYWWLDAAGKRVLLEHEVGDLGDDARLRAAEMRAEFNRLAKAVRWLAAAPPAGPLPAELFKDGGALFPLVAERTVDSTRGLAFDLNCLDWLAVVEAGPDGPVARPLRGAPALTATATALAIRALDPAGAARFAAQGGVAMPAPFVTEWPDPKTAVCRLYLAAPIPGPKPAAVLACANVTLMLDRNLTRWMPRAAVWLLDRERNVLYSPLPGEAGAPLAGTHAFQQFSVGLAADSSPNPFGAHSADWREQMAKRGTEQLPRDYLDHEKSLRILRPDGQALEWRLEKHRFKLPGGATVLKAAEARSFNEAVRELLDKHGPEGLRIGEVSRGGWYFECAHLKGSRELADALAELRARLGPKLEFQRDYPVDCHGFVAKLVLLDHAFDDGAAEPLRLVQIAAADELVQDIATRFWRLGKWAALACAALAAVAFWLAWRFVEPLNALSKAAGGIGRWAEHDDGPEQSAEALFAQLPTSGPNEMMGVAEGFRAFVPKLQEMRDRLRKANAELDSRVRRRTQELELRNIELDFQRGKLEAALADAEAAANAKGRLMSVMSHELRQPLNTVIGYAEALREEAEDRMEPALAASVGKDLDLILQAARHLLAVINEVLDHAKLEAHAVTLRPEAVGTPALCQFLRGLAGPLAEANRNRLSIELAPSAPATVVADQHRLKQILLNLLSNACKFTVDGVVSLRIEAAERHGQAGVRFAVADTGRGIPADQMGKLFEKFYQVDDSIRRERGGTGLGLAICKELGDLMGGAIDVESTEGVGSTFALWLPGETRAAAPPDALVLLLDDDPASRRLAAAELAKAGHRVAEAATIEDALRLVRAERPAVIAVNLASAHRSEAIAALRADPASADVPLALALPGAAAPADWFVKPIDWRIVARRLDDFRGAADRPRLLVIDDDPAHRDLARRQLGSVWEVVVAAEGAEGLREVAARRPDAILLDLFMPGLDGFAFMQRLHGLGLQPPVPVLVATAKDSYARSATIADVDAEAWPRRIAEALARGPRA